MKRVPKGPYKTSIRPKTNNAPDIFFDLDTLQRLGRPTMLLNSDAINGSAELLRCFYDDNCIVIFSTFLSSASDDEQLWRFVKRTNFWDTEIWVFPIHLPHDKHWALATAYNGRQVLDVFDSLGARSIEEKVENVRLILYLQ